MTAKNSYFSFFAGPFLKKHPFPIVNSDSYNVDIIMNYADNEVKID